MNKDSFQSLSYKNESTDYILREIRAIDYAETGILYDYGNLVQMVFTLSLDLVQLSKQADIFSRHMMSNRGDVEFKRFMGSKDSRWNELLYKAYIYDRLKCIYYGLNSQSISDYPSTSYSFPGNILLMRMLNKRVFNFSIIDGVSYNMTVTIDWEKDKKISDFFKPFFDEYPDLAEGLCDIPNAVSYQNTQYEAVLKGLYNARDYIRSKISRNGNKSKDFFEIYEMNTDKITSFLSEESIPIVNSFLGPNGDKEWYFTTCGSAKAFEGLRFNESIWFSRAVGLISKQLEEHGNPMFRKVKIKEDNADTKNELHAITGIRSNLEPFSQEQIKGYLNVLDVEELLLNKFVQQFNNTNVTGGNKTDNFQSGG